MTMLTQPELIKIPYSKFLKLELPRFAQRLIELVERHNPEELKIEKMFDLMLAELPRIGRLTDKYGPHPLTEELETLRKMRALRISEIRFHLKVVIREDKSRENKDVIVAKNAINHFLQNLESSKNEEMFNQKVVQFLDAIKSEPELGASLASLNFTDHIANLQVVHVSIQSLITKRSTSMSKRLEETTAELREGVIYATRNLVKQVELAPLLNPEIDYGPLFIEMNQLFIEFKNLVNRRILFNARKAEANFGNRSNQAAVTTLIADSEGKMMRFGAEEVDINGQEVNQVKVEPVENEKAAATSSKTMQLPLVDNENGALEK